jgi:hypothetical protein
MVVVSEKRRALEEEQPQRLGSQAVRMPPRAPSAGKALINSLSGCSAGLKKHVAKRNLLSRNKIPLSVSEIRKLVDAAGIACSSESAVDVVTGPVP